MDDAARKAMDQALRWLTFRPRSERELADRLEKKGVAPEMTRGVVVRLRELGLLNDAGLARDAVDSFRRVGRGDHRIRQDLRKRGLPNDLVEEALAREAVQDVAERAWAVLQRRAARIKGLDRDRAYRRLHGFLLRQGFDVDDARSALKRFFSGGPEEERGEP